MDAIKLSMESTSVYVKRRGWHEAYPVIAPAMIPPNAPESTAADM